MNKKAKFLVGAVLLALGSAAQAGNVNCEMNQLCSLTVDKEQVTVIVKVRDRTQNYATCTIWIEGKLSSEQKLLIGTNGDGETLAILPRPWYMPDAGLVQSKISSLHGADFVLSMNNYNPFFPKPQPILMKCEYRPS